MKTEYYLFILLLFSFFLFKGNMNEEKLNNYFENDKVLDSLMRIPPLEYDSVNFDNKYSLIIKKYEDFGNLGPTANLFYIKNQNNELIFRELISTIYLEDFIIISKKKNRIIIEKHVSTISYHQYHIIDFQLGKYFSTKSFDIDYRLEEVFEKNEKLYYKLIDISDSTFSTFQFDNVIDFTR